MKIIQKFRDEIRTILRRSRVIANGLVDSLYNFKNCYEGERRKMKLSNNNKIGGRLIKSIKSIRNPRVIARVIRDPKKYLFYLIQGSAGMYARDLIRLEVPAKIVMKYINELRSDKEFYTDLFTKIELAKNIDSRIGGYLPVDLLEVIYAIVRYYKPKTIVETGVGMGSTSVFILKALHANGDGILYSIDLPGFDKKYYPTVGKHYDIHVPNGWEVGWLIPTQLKYKHKLILGDAKLELPKLLEEIEVIDAFLHDSLHTYEHMMFEYNHAWAHLSQGGILMSDDVNEYWSLAFVDFCKEKGLKHVIIGNRLGIAEKELKVEHD